MGYKKLFIVLAIIAFSIIFVATAFNIGQQIFFPAIQNNTVFSEPLNETLKTVNFITNSVIFIASILGLVLLSRLI
jgi:hypothetical protein